MHCGGDLSSGPQHLGPIRQNHLGIRVYYSISDMTHDLKVVIVVATISCATSAARALIRLLIVPSNATKRTDSKPSETVNWTLYLH